MPQEMRSRFWYVLLERPDLAQQLLVRKKGRALRELEGAVAVQHGIHILWHTQCVGGGGGVWLLVQVVAELGIGCEGVCVFGKLK